LDRLIELKPTATSFSPKPPTPNDHDIDLAVGIDQNVINIANLAVGFVIDELFVPVSDCEA
jgi:hypothetical protein